MDFEYSARQKALIRRVSDFMDAHILPAVPVYEAQQAEGDPWKVIPVVEDLKATARAAGLWNMFMPPSVIVFQKQYKGHITQQNIYLQIVRIQRYNT